MHARLLRPFVVAITPSAIIIMLLLSASAQQPQDSGQQIFIGKPDGSEMKPLLELPEFTMQSSPAWSQDGTLIVFDAWRADRGEKEADAKVVVVNADGSDAKTLGDGAIPSFSPRHQRLAFTRYQANHGIWVMSSAGPEAELVQIDKGYGAAKWSPDGRRIAYTTTRNNEVNLYLYDLIEGDEMPLFEEGQSPYSSFFRNIAWSPDGRQIAFKGQRVDSQTVEVALVDARGARHGHTVRYESKTLYNVSWNHDGSRLYFAQETPTRNNRVQLYSLVANDMSPPEILPGQDPNRANSAAAISPDGKQLLSVSRKPVANNAAKNKGNKANK